MKLAVFFLGLVSLSSAQTFYVAQRTTTLSGAAEVITIQQPASNPKLVKLKSAYIDCSVACTVTLERNGTAATTTALTIANVNGQDPTVTATAFRSSNVGNGTVIQVSAIPAGSYQVFDLSNINLPLNSTTATNFTLRTSSITGTVNITILFTEQSQ